MTDPQGSEPETGSTIGPYRIERRLGHGGMGEVFLAHDTRLDRAVALKRCRLGGPRQQRSAERLEREARAAAKLSHASIVQIHDVVQAADTTWLVFEYVDGRTLRQVLEEDEPALGRILELAIQIAEGLTAAHAAGLIHRDLKSENVLVAADGRAKIADFGLAMARVPLAERLTDPDVVVGTARAMAPEQAGGESVDFRADLFAFGVLLYEAVAGRSPFRAGDDAQTLERILHDPHRPLAEAAPGVPAALAALVDHLLAKRPEHRPRTTGEVVAALCRLTKSLPDDSATLAARPAASTAAPQAGARPLAMLTRGPRRLAATPAGRIGLGGGVLAVAAVFAVVVGGLGRGTGTAPRVVAVLEPTVTADEPPPLLVAALEDGLDRGLRSLEAVSIARRDELQGELRGAGATPTAIARALAVDDLIATTIRCGSGTCAVTIERIGEAGTGLWRESLAWPGELMRLGAEAVAASVRSAFPEQAAEANTDRVLDDALYGRYLTLRLADERQTLPLDEIIAEAEALSRQLPSFVDLHVLRADTLRRRYRRSRQTGDLAAARAAAGNALQLAPEDPRGLNTLFSLALDTGALDEANRIVEQLGERFPALSAVDNQRARLAERRGERERALALMARAAERRPSWRNLFTLANMAYRHGRHEMARRTLASLLERAPENLHGIRLWGQIELLEGSLDNAIELFGKAHTLSRRHDDAVNLGVAYLIDGRFTDAAVRFRAAVGAEPNNPAYLLNLAEAEARLGNAEVAADLYRRAIDATPRDEPSPLERTTRAQALAHLGENAAAVEAAQAALEAAPEQPQVLLEAALVYAVVGDRTAAEVLARRALAAGIHPRWLDLPAFGDLASRLERP